MFTINNLSVNSNLYTLKISKKMDRACQCEKHRQDELLASY